MTRQRKILWMLIAAYTISALICIAGLALWVLMPTPAYRHEIAKVKARGEPWELSEFVQPKVAPEENAALLYCQAAEKLNINYYYEDIIIQTKSLPLSPLDVEGIDDMVRSNPEPLQLMRRAADMPKVEWEFPIEGSQYKLMPDEHLYDKIRFYKLERLVRLTMLAALRAHEQSNDLDALLHVKSILQLARAQRKVPTLVGFSEANRTDAEAIQALHQLSWDIKLNPANEVELRNLIVRMIRELLNERELEQDYQQQIFGERRLDYLRQRPANLLDSSNASVTRLQGKIWTYASEVAKAKTMADAKRIPVVNPYREPVDDGRYQTAVQIRSHMKRVAGYPTHLAHRRFRLLADRRMAAIALAVRLYAIDHGQRPAALQDLVDHHYLDSIPQDPLAENAPIRYIADGEHPRLYSVGTNGIDDGGSLEMPKYCSTSFLRSETLDTPFFVDRPINDIMPDCGNGGYGWGAPMTTQPSTPEHTTTTDRTKP